MARRTALVVLIPLLFLASGSRIALSQQPAGPLVVARHQLDVTNAPGPFDLVQLVQVFPPGARTPLHAHGGQGLVTVLQGELTQTVAGVETRYKAGESFVEHANEAMQVSNTTDTQAIMVVTFVLPQGAPLTTVHEEGGTAPQAPGPVVFSRHQLAVTNAPGQFDLVQLVQAFAPGARTPVHSHGGQGLVTVLEGEITQVVGGIETRYKAGERFVENANEVMQVSNNGNVLGVMVVTFVLPKGAPLTTVQAPAPAPEPAPAPAPVLAPAPAAPAPPALQATGGPVPQPVALPDTGSDSWYLSMLMLATVLLLGGIAVRRPRRRGAR